MAAVVIIVIIIPLNPDITQQLPSYGSGVIMLSTGEMLPLPFLQLAGECCTRAWTRVLLGRISNSELSRCCVNVTQQNKFRRDGEELPVQN